jgi:hypothetical protein
MQSCVLYRYSEKLFYIERRERKKKYFHTEGISMVNLR